MKIISKFQINYWEKQIFPDFLGPKTIFFSSAPE